MIVKHHAVRLYYTIWSTIGNFVGGLIFRTCAFGMILPSPWRGIASTSRVVLGVITMLLGSSQIEEIGKGCGKASATRRNAQQYPSNM
jgi:hypothetical protein